MGALGYKLFPSLAAERDRLAAVADRLSDWLRTETMSLRDAENEAIRVKDELAAMTLRAVSAEAVSRQAAKEAAEAYHRIVALNDELAAKTLECVQLRWVVDNVQKPAPLEPTTIKVGTAADVRRIVEQQNFRDEQENSDGIR